MTDDQWAAMTEQEQKAMVAKVVFGYVVEMHGEELRIGLAEAWAHCPDYTTAWSGTGLVIDRMKELGWNLVLWIKPKKQSCARFERRASLRAPLEYANGEAKSPKQAIALAAWRAIQEEEK